MVNEVINTCPICNAQSKSLQYDYKDTLFGSTIFKNKTISVCTECGFGYENSHISQADLNRFYTNEYRTDTIFTRKRLKRALTFSNYPYRAMAQLSLISKYIDNSVRILDIGAGYGDTFDVAKKLFPQSQGYVFEPDLNTQQILEKKSITIYPEMFSATTDCEKLSGKFDIIIMSHVLEHYDVSNLNAIISNLYKLLSDNGVLFIEVPNDDFRQIAKMRNNDAPHLLFFSQKALKLLLQKSGFTVVFENTCGTDLNKYHNGKTLIKIPGIKTLKRIYERMTVKYKNNEFFHYGENRIWIRLVIIKK